MLLRDYTKLLATVNNDEDHESSANDRISLITWSDKWQLIFSAIKCNIMLYERQNSNYTIRTNNEVAKNMYKNRLEKLIG